MDLHGTIGYKLHQQISKGLQRRSETIRKAIARYNVQAAALNPPQPPISWKDITQYTFLSEFDLLRHTRDDVRECIWAKPAVCGATAKFFKLCHAKEEVTRLNVEIVAYGQLYMTKRGKYYKPLPTFVILSRYLHVNSSAFTNLAQW